MQVSFFFFDFHFVLFQIIHIDPESSEGTIYCIHYAGWNNRYAECSIIGIVWPFRWQVVVHCAVQVK